MVPQSDKEIGDVRMTPARLGRREQTELWMEVVESQDIAGEIQVVEDKSKAGKSRKGRSSRFERVI